MIDCLLRNDLENRECGRTVFLKYDIEILRSAFAHIVQRGRSMWDSTFTQSTFKDTMLDTCGYRSQLLPISTIDIFAFSN